MEFILHEVDRNGNPIKAPETINLEVTKEEYERELEIFCDCDYLENHPKESPKYVESAKIPKIGKVNHHGWICPGCKKYTQVG